MHLTLPYVCPWLQARVVLSQQRRVSSAWRCREDVSRVVGESFQLGGLHGLGNGKELRVMMERLPEFVPALVQQT